MRSTRARFPLAPAVTLVAVFAGLALPGMSGTAQAQGRRLTLEEASGQGKRRPSFSGSAPGYRWNAEGTRLGFTEAGKRQWLDPRTGTVTPAEPEGSEGEEDSGDEARKDHEAALAALDGIDEKDAGRLARRPRHRSDDGQAAIFIHGERALFHRVGGDVRELDLGDLGSIELGELSPNGEHFAFVRHNNLEVVDTTGGARRAVTSDGGPEQFHGKLDWVYQEEIYGRGDFKGFWWSPNSKHISFLSLDESPVHDFTVIDHIVDGTKRVDSEITNYPKAGDPNPIARLSVVDAAGGNPRSIDLSAYGDQEFLVVRVGWSPGGDRCVFEIQDRIQTWLDLCVADPASGEVETWIHETSPTWTYRIQPPRWQEDGGFLWLSDRTGHRHLYRYAADGTLSHAVTQGDWDVWDIQGIDTEAGQLWFTGNQHGAANANIYRVNLDGSGHMRLTQGDGTHSVSFNADRSMFLDRYSSLSQVPSVRVCDREGAILRELGRAEIPDLEAYDTSTWKSLEILCRDGFPLDAALLLPTEFDPAKQYPVWLPTYSGPNAPSVRNRWNSSAYMQYLAQQGFIVLQVNVRSASRKGRDVVDACYKQLAVQELMDLEDAVAWLTSHPWADADRVGITGWSYGGTMTAFALTHSKAFRLGIAGAGVYDWGMYDTIYTERYMSTPQLNPEGYAATSVLKAADQLHGHLVLLHGTKDDNVHFQNTVQFTYALQKAGKSFEMMIYPESRHGIRDRDLSWHRRQLEWSAMREHLLESRAPGSPE